MSEIEPILEELAITYEQLSIFYDWNEQFSSSTFNSVKISQVLSRLLSASKSETALLLSLSRGSSMKPVASSCDTFEQEQLAIENVNQLIGQIEPRLEYDFTINEELRSEAGSTYFIVIPWKQEDEILGIYVFSRRSAPYSHQENVLLGNSCTEFGIMLKNKNLSTVLKERNVEIANLLTNTVGNLSETLEKLRNSWDAEANYQAIKTSIEDTYLKHLFALVSVLESIHPAQAKRTENIKSVCRIIGTQLGFDAGKMKELELAASLCDVSFTQLNQLDYGRYISGGTINLDNELMEAIRLHPSKSADMLRPLESMRAISRIIACHHEYFDGSGYPEGISGDEIPEASSIIGLGHHLAHRSEHHYKSVIDLLDMPSERKWLAKKASRMFSPKIVKALYLGVGLQPPFELD